MLGTALLVVYGVVPAAVVGWGVYMLYLVVVLCREGAPLLDELFPNGNCPCCPQAAWDDDEDDPEEEVCAASKPRRVR